jgi:MFS transporter, DHA1 family, tetracycline resistance protein
MRVRAMKKGGAEVPGSPPWVRIGVLLATVFIDLVGFGIVLPLLPLYADRFGASGTQIGILVLSYSAAQLLLAPIWGALSDRFGRRRILIVGLLGSAVSYLVFAYAGSVAILLLSRIMAGVGGANIPVAQAYVADLTPPEKRAGYMGLIGAAFGLGFIFGPVLAGVLAPIAPELPGLAAAGLCAGNAVLAVFFLPESRPSRNDGELGTATPARVGALLGQVRQFRAVLARRDLSAILLLTLLFTTAFSFMHPTFPLFASERFGLAAREVGWLFAYLGLVSALVQGLLVRVMVARMGEEWVVRRAALPFVAGFLLIAWAPAVPYLLLGLALLALGFGGTLPALVSLLSQSASREVQGGSLGVGQSVGAMGRIVGPLIAGILWDLAGPAWPYLIAAGIAGIAGIHSLSLRAIVEGDEGPGGVRTVEPGGWEG